MKIKCDDDFIDLLADAYLNDNNQDRNNRARNNHHTVTHKTACETHFWQDFSMKLTDSPDTQILSVLSLAETIIPTMLTFDTFRK